MSEARSGQNLTVEVSKVEFKFAGGPSLVLSHVRRAHEDGEDEVHEEVEGDERDEEVVRLRLGQLGLVELHGEEDGDDADNLQNEFTSISKAYNVTHREHKVQA